MENIIESLEEITSEGGDGNFFIIHLDDLYYLQCLGQNGSTEVLCEAVGNQFLEEGQKLSAQQNDLLLSLGWSEPDFGNYTKSATLSKPEDFVALAELLAKTAKEVYQLAITDDTEYTVELE